MFKKLLKEAGSTSTIPPFGKISGSFNHHPHVAVQVHFALEVSGFFDYDLLSNL